jgi:hypothetical protein
VGIRYSQGELPVKASKGHWRALAVYVAIVAFLASVYPANPLIIQILLSFVLFGAFQLVLGTKYSRVPTRATFWTWFVIVCALWLLYLWKLLTDVAFGSPNAGL